MVWFYFANFDVCMRTIGLEDNIAADRPFKWKKTGLAVVCVLAYSVFLEICEHLITYGTFRTYDNWRHELINHLANIAPLFLMTGAIALIIFYVTDRGILSRNFFLKLALDIVLTAAATIGAYLLMLWVIRFFASGVELAYGSILAVYLITLLMIEMLYYMLVTKKAYERAEQQKRRALQYQYDAFRAQVNPHFLFNSLNILMDIIENDKDKAGEFTQALADIYRYVLSTHRKTRVQVSEEMDFLESYIHILTLKYNNFLNVEIHKELTSTRYIIPFTMQILVENVTKHNIISDKYPMKVDIIVGEDCITVRNKIMLKRNESGTGLGLRYIHTQYNSVGKTVSISNDGTYFTAKIPYL